MWNINGKIINNEQELRDFCFNVAESGKPFKQDFRIAANAYKLPITSLLDLLEKRGHNVEKIENSI